MKPETLYVGLDSTQYSNGMFKEGKTREICVAVFSTDTWWINKDNCNKKRDFSILEDFLEDKNSASLTIGPDEVKIKVRPLIYSAGQLIPFYAKEVLKNNLDKIELHIDGPMYADEKRYLKSILGNLGKITVESYKKCCRKNGYVTGKGIRPQYCTQPKIVLAADALSNFLFRKNGNGLFTNLDSRETRIIPIQINGKTVQHYVLNH